MGLHQLMNLKNFAQILPKYLHQAHGCKQGALTVTSSLSQQLRTPAAHEKTTRKNWYRYVELEERLSIEVPSLKPDRPIHDDLKNTRSESTSPNLSLEREEITYSIALKEREKLSIQKSRRCRILRLLRTPSIRRSKAPNWYHSKALRDTNPAPPSLLQTAA
ncbi:hypothetical protein F511_31889 [Dorcoceras hygrometricum]|uniref:Uncharacterized protein n=1 Tax=Dorcoceras hygrometricum TaxID=472368 RepID=A0A2Z7AWT2_9LAMI|nr:hypothetical protein F511_31889 [Dorcoceras hygrometricum]